MNGKPYPVFTKPAFILPCLHFGHKVPGTIFKKINFWMIS